MLCPHFGTIFRYTEYLKKRVETWEKEALTEIAQRHDFEIISLGTNRPHMESMFPILKLTQTTMATLIPATCSTLCMNALSVEQD